MDEKLKLQLKQMGLFPLEIDEEAQKELREQSIDPSKLETHYNPGTPEHVIARYERIRKNVLKLHEMDTANAVKIRDYRETEKAIEQDLFESIHPIARTGVCGVYRDPISKIILLNLAVK